MSDENRINPAARFIARNARYWDPVAAFHLLEALSHNLATLFPPRERYAKLGLLIRLISVGTGEVPSVEAYDAARTAAKKLGESWPSRSDLNYSYGSWSKAVKAAMETFYSHGRVSTSTRHARLDKVAYTNDEIVEQLFVCRESIGFEPNQWEYEEWGPRRATAQPASRPSASHPRPRSDPEGVRKFRQRGNRRAQYSSTERRRR